MRAGFSGQRKRRGRKHEEAGSIQNGKPAERGRCRPGEVQDRKDCRREAAAESGNLQKENGRLNGKLCNAASDHNLNRVHFLFAQQE